MTEAKIVELVVTEQHPAHHARRSAAQIAELRAIPDTNIYVSAALRSAGPPAQIIRAWQQAQFELITSGELLSEIGETLSLIHISEPTRPY